VSFLFLKDWASDWRAYVAEFLGTFVFVFISCGVTLANLFYVDIGVLGVALTSGLVYTAMLFATINSSGGYLNPVVTLALWLVQKMKGHLAFFYVLIQLLASFAAAGLLILIFGSSAKEFSLGGPVLAAGVSQQTAVIIEAILTAIIVFAVFATIVDKKNSTGFGPLAIGLVVTGASIFAVSITGAAFNPVRALGPLLLSRSYESIVVWIIGPLAGSLFGIVYEFLFLRKGKK
jgi:MIP family channel proteins